MGLRHEFGKAGGGRFVGEQHVDVSQVAQLHHGRAVEFAVVCGQPDLAGMLDDGAGHLDFAVVVVTQGAVGFDAADANQANVDFELPNEVHRRFAHDALVAAAHLPPGHDHFAVAVRAHQRGDVQVVGDDAQAPVVVQFVGHGFDGGADVHDERAAVGNALGHGFGDAQLACRLHGLALAVGDVFGGGARQAHAAMKAGQQTGFGQALHITAHGLQGHPKTFGQGFDGHGAL